MANDYIRQALLAQKPMVQQPMQQADIRQPMLRSPQPQQSVDVFDLPEEARPFTLSQTAKGQIMPKFNLNTRSGMAFAMKAQGMDDNSIAQKFGLQDASQLGQMIQSDFAQLKQKYGENDYEKRLKEAQLKKLERETELLGEPSVSERKALKEESKYKNTIIEAANEKKALAEDIKNDSALSSAVGPNALARFGPLDTFSGARRRFVSKTEGLLADETLNALISAKDAGATFGALSEDELRLLKNAASRINFAKVTDDKGNVTGYSLSEADFKDALDTLIQKTDKAVKRLGGSTPSSQQTRTTNESAPQELDVQGQRFRVGADGLYYPI